MFVLWLGEQISEKGIGNGVSLMIFAGIIVSLPTQIAQLSRGLGNGTIQWYAVVLLVALFLASTWLVVFFTTAQRRIPMQHMRRNVGTRAVGGQTSYLPLSVNTAGVIPIIFAVSLLQMPSQFALMSPESWAIHDTLLNIARWLSPVCWRKCCRGKTWCLWRRLAALAKSEICISLPLLKYCGLCAIRRQKNASATDDRRP